jgi:hypothetical protein
VLKTLGAAVGALLVLIFLVTVRVETRDAAGDSRKPSARLRSRR